MFMKKIDFYLALQILIVFCLSINVKPVFAETFHKIKILELNKDKSAVKIDYGLLDGVKAFSKGKIYWQRSERYPDLTLVAEIEAIKSVDRTSLWRVIKFHKKEFLEKNQTLVFVYQDEVLKGRADYKTLKRVMVIPEIKKRITHLKDLNRGVPEEIIKREDDYTSYEELLDKTALNEEHDLEYIEIQKWRKTDRRVEDEHLGNVALFEPEILPKKRKEREKLVDAAKTETFNTTVDRGVSYANSLKGGVNDLHKDIEEKPYQGVLKNSYKTFLDFINKERLPDEAQKRLLERYGANWSKTMSDKQIRDFLITSGTVEEGQRQHFSYKNAIARNEFSLKAGRGMATDSINSSDSLKGYDGEFLIGYERHIKNFEDLTTKWSIEAAYHNTRNYFSLKNANVVSYESSYKLVGNYYFYNYPSTVKEFIFYSGIGIKYGSASLRSTFVDKKYSYQMQSLPYFQVGAKYRVIAGDQINDVLPFGVGLSTLISYEQTKFTPNGADKDNQIGVVSSSDMRFLFGINIYL